MKSFLALTIAFVLFGWSQPSTASVYNASNLSQLTQALSKARGGDKIALSGGNYGTLTLNAKQSPNLRFNSKVQIYSNSSSNRASFNHVSLTDVENLEFNGVNMKASGSTPVFFANGTDSISIVGCKLEGKLDSNGYGAGIGVKIANSSNPVIRDSEVKNFYTGFNIFTSDDIQILNNQVLDISYDGTSITKVHGLLIQNNYFRKKSRPDIKHQDIIQFGNFGTTPAASDIRILNNILEAKDATSHGIYMGNGQAKKVNNQAYFYKNILIQGNTLRTSQLSAIGIGQSVGVTIIDNDVLRHPDSTAAVREITTPSIKVADDSKTVVIRLNNTYVQPSAADDNWQDRPRPAGWTITDNNILPKPR